MSVYGSTHNDMAAGTLRTPAGTRPRVFTFVQLVFESQWIAVGKVAATSAGGAPPITLSVERSFPEGLSRQLRVVSEAAHQGAPLSFTVGESVVLFLRDARDAQAVLMGEGDVSKWPRQSSDWQFTAGHVCPLPEVVKVIEMLRRVHAMKTYEERAQFLLNELAPSGTLGQIAAAQFASDDERWDGAQSKGEIGLAETHLLVAGKMLLTLGRRDLAVDLAALQLLADAPASAAIPLLIERLNDANAAVRGTAFASLQTATLSLTEETFGYEPDSPPDQRAASIQGWQQWWAGRRTDCLRRDVPNMLSELESPHLLKRMTANYALRLISKRDVGYNPEAHLSRRSQEASKWQAWWGPFSRQLK